MFKLEKYYLWQSGGFCMVDIFNGDTDCIAVTDELIVYHTKTNCGYGPDGNDDDYCEGYLAIDLCEIDPDLKAGDNGSVIAFHDEHSFTLNSGKKFQFDDIRDGGLFLAKSNPLNTIEVTESQN